MNYSVAKIGGENLSLDRLEDYKTNTGVDFICPVLYLLVKPEKISFIINFESQSVYTISLVFASVEISLKQIIQELPVEIHILKKERQYQSCTHRTEKPFARLLLFMLAFVLLKFRLRAFVSDISELQ